jgi:uncharacterized protein (DUF952 family)
VDVAALDASCLKWEPSRGGALFPHLYGVLSMAAIASTYDIVLKDDGSHDFSCLDFNPPAIQP